MSGPIRHKVQIRRVGGGERRRKREEYVNKRGASIRWRSRIRHALFNAAKEPPVRKMAEHGEREYELAPTN